jgi:isopropylmalate/homocitrate/citramalate synthase
VSLSPYNDRHTAIGGGSRIELNDCTLREGEQSAIVNFKPEQKVTIACRLAEAGIKRIQVGYAGLSDTDWRTFKALKEREVAARLESVVLTYLPSWREQIAATATSGADTANLVHVPSPPRRERIFDVTPAQIRARTIDAVRAAKDHGLHVTYSPADTTRTEIEVVLDLVGAAVEAGADVIAVADTVGAATPGAVRWLVERVRDTVRVPLAFHGHNDFGMASANAIAAVEAGAAIVDTTLNGWGDRTGNPPTEEFAAILQLLYGAAPDLDLIGLASLSKDVAADIGVAVPSCKPVTGEVAFAHKLETHVLAVLRHPPAFEAYDPANVGGTRQVAIGQYSGPQAIRSRLEATGFSGDETQMARIVEAVRSEARSTNRALSDHDLRAIVDRLASQPPSVNGRDR